MEPERQRHLGSGRYEVIHAANLRQKHLPAGLYFYKKTGGFFFRGDTYIQFKIIIDQRVAQIKKEIMAQFRYSYLFSGQEIKDAWIISP